MSECGQAGARNLGEPPPAFVAGGSLAMRPSNMGIHLVATASAEQAPASAGDSQPFQRRRLDEDGEAVPGNQDTVLAEQARLALAIDEPRGRAAAGGRGGGIVNGKLGSNRRSRSTNSPQRCS